MHSPVVELLLAAGADPNLRFNGMPPLHHAIDVEMDSVLQSLQRVPSADELPEPEITACLLRGGADPRRRDAEGKSALEFASAYGHRRAVALLSCHAQVT